MFKRVVVMTAALATLVPALALAQQRPTTPRARPGAQPQRPAPQRPAIQDRSGSIELSIGAGGITVDRALNGKLDAINLVDSDPGRIMIGGAARLGYNLNRNIGLSLGSAFGTGNGATAISPFAALTYTFNLNRKMSPFFTAGAGLTRFSGNANRATADYGAHGGVGIRSMLSDNVALRVEGRMAYEKYGDTRLDLTGYNGMASAGLSYFMGGGPPRDTDGDGVPDKRDRCANTPRGATVDARGCPVDSDRDAVPDGLDRCANTPSGVRVDANGCPLDTDRDGVADHLDRCANTPAGTPVDANGCPRDADGDGVADNLDRCPNTPAGTRVDANGCPRDSDGDGVADNLDRCPNTPAGTPVDANGCPRDSDGDGVTDNLDRCANTAPGTQVDANGCPVQRDSDGDGVIDANDRCANTPRGARVDSAGCPLAELPPAAGEVIILRNVLFRSGTAALLPVSEAALDGMATAIIATPGLTFEIGGHSDALGNPAMNQRLSQARAEAVRDYLVSKGVPADRLTAAGYGSSRPVASNRTAAGRAQNRRVELKRTS